MTANLSRKSANPGRPDTGGKNMKRKWIRVLGLLMTLALIAAACGSSDDGATADTDTGEETDTSADDGDSGDDSGDDSDDSGDDADDSGDDGGDVAASGEAGSDGELVMLQWQAVSQANGLLSTGTKDLLASSLVLEPLAEIDPTGQVVPALAAEIPSIANGGIAEDNSSITWTLQEGVLWSDGTPFTADDVVFTWEYCSDEATGCQTQALEFVDTVEAIDDLTVTINFTEPQPFPFAPFVTFQNPIIQRAQFADCVGEASVGCSDQNFAPIGTGPFSVTELIPEDFVTFEMNANYRGVADGYPRFSSVRIEGGGDAESTARSVLEIGEADYAWNLQVAPEILAPMEAQGIATLASAFTANVEHILLNQTDPLADPPSEGTPHPLFVDNPDLSQALSIAINRDELVAVGYGASGNPTCNIWPVGAQSSTNNDVCLTQDIDGANALLDGLGYVDTDGDGIREADGFGPLEFDFITSTNAVRQSNQELIQSYWEDIGVAANMTNADAGLFFDGTCASAECIWRFTSPMQMFTNGASNPWAPGYMANWESTKIPTSETNWGGENIVRYVNPDFDTLSIEAQASPLDDPGFDDRIIELNDLVSTGPIIPLIHRADVSAFANTISGVGDLNGWDSEYWNIEEWSRN